PSIPSTTPASPRGVSTACGSDEIMASKKTVTVENLAALGTDRLVGILMALAKDADIRRRLRLELAGQAGSEAERQAFGANSPKSRGQDHDRRGTLPICRAFSIK